MSSAPTSPTIPTARTAYHHGELRSTLLEAALAMLEEGIAPAALSLREAARRAGVSAMAPYRHFADRDALLAAVATIGFERLAQTQRAADSGGSGRQALKAQGVAYVAFACANPALFRLMFGSGAPSKSDKGRSEELARAGADSFGILAERVADVRSEPVKPGRPSDQALAHWSLVHGLAMLAIDGQLCWCADDPVALAERIAELAVGTGAQNGMAAPSQAKKPPLSRGAKPSTTSKR